MAAKQKQKLNAATAPATIESIGEDLLQCILSRLPAESCASAVCVNCCWNLIITRLLTLPNLSSALSRHPCLQISRRFGCHIPVITSISYGIFGQDANTNEFEEVQWWNSMKDDESHEDLRDEDQGVSVTLGFLPGLTVDLIPLKKTRGLMTEDFISAIRDRSFSRSGSSPMGFFLFSAKSHDNSTRLMATTKELDINLDGETILDPIYDELGDHTHSQLLYVGVRKTRKCNSRYKIQDGYVCMNSIWF